MKSIKEKFFIFANQQLKFMASYNILFVILKIFSLFQMQAISFMAFYNIFPRNSFAKLLYNTGKVLILDVGNIIIIRIIVFLIMFTMALLIILAIVSIFNKYLKSGSYISIALVQISSIATLLFAYVLIIQVQYFIMNIFLCNDFDKCLSIEHIVWIIIGIITQKLKIINTENDKETRPTINRKYSAFAQIFKEEEKPRSKSGQVSTGEELKRKLAESLSPSPFKNEDPIKREAQLEHLVASAPCTTKSIIFFPFYGAEMMGKEGYRVWKIALKDHIVHTLESICLIKNLNPVPIHIIEKKKLVVNSLDPSICLYN